MTAKNTGNPDDYKMPLIDHLVELRRRLMWSFLALAVCVGFCLVFADRIYDFLARPLYDVLKDMLKNVPNAPAPKLIFTQLYEAFFTNIKVGFYAGLFMSFPVFAYQMWRFIAPGLYKNEQRAFLPFLIATPFLFFAGGAFAYYLVFPAAWQFFAEFQKPATDASAAIELLPRVADYLSLVIKMIFAFGICFETPVFLSLLARAGIVSAKGLAEKRRYAIVIIFIIAAVITPPDVISQIALAIPMCLLYEVSILIAKLMEKRKAEREAALDAELAGTAAPKPETKSPAE